MRNKFLMTLTLTIIILCTIIFSAFAESNENKIYLNIKVGKSYNKGESIKISSNEALSIYKVDDLSSALFNLTKVEADITLSGSRVLYDGKSDYDLCNGQFIMGSPQNEVSINNKKYRGYVSFRINDGKIDVVNFVELEDYLKGVVPNEISYDAPMEALKAQAVASRSFAISNKEKYKKKGYNLQDGTYSQVYNGISSEEESTNKAVDDTRGIFALHNGNVASTIFHASSGGYTESSSNVWGGKDTVMIGKKDDYSIDTLSAKWELKISRSDLKNKLDSSGYSIGEPTAIKFLSFFPSGRINKLEITGSEKSINLSGENLRSILGTTKLKSTWFDIGAYPELSVSEEKKSEDTVYNGEQSLTSWILSPIENTSTDNTQNLRSPKTINLDSDIVFMGRGYGHGAGMSQYGAINMAKKGFDYKTILKFYYSNIEFGGLSR